MDRERCLCVLGMDGGNSVFVCAELSEVTSPDLQLRSVLVQILSARAK